MATADSQDVAPLDGGSPSLNLHQDDSKDSRSPLRSAKRQKVTRACDSCKSRKRRCTGEWPCTSCWYDKGYFGICASTDILAVGFDPDLSGFKNVLTSGKVSSGAECTYKASYTRGKLVQPLPSTRADETTSIPSAADRRQVQSTSEEPARPGLEAVDGVDSNGRTSRAASPEGEAAALAGQYSGPTSAYSFLRRAWRRFGLNVNQQEEKESGQAVTIFSYGDKQFPRSAALTTLPDRQWTAEMFSIYFDFAMPTYRFLHQPTVTTWLQRYHEQVETHTEPTSLMPARQAIVLMVLATASLFDADSNAENTRNGREAWHVSEPYFQAAQTKLASETGKVRLEAVQARLAMCLYLLHTSRPNQAWYTFGITSQILMALGMHRARSSSTSQLDAVTTECRKRALWAAFTLDTYLSVILGRPTLIHSDDVDQQFPEAVDDEDLNVSGILTNRLRRDPVIQGSIFHAKITRIAKKALKEQYSVHRHRDSYRLTVATRLNAEVAEWRQSLPVVLSGAIHPSSLIQIFQRQIIVLELAHSLAVILINRPLLLIDSNVDNKSNVNACLSAAKSILDIVLQFVSDTRSFPAFVSTLSMKPFETDHNIVTSFSTQFHCLLTFG